MTAPLHIAGTNGILETKVSGLFVLFFNLSDTFFFGLAGHDGAQRRNIKIEKEENRQ